MGEDGVQTPHPRKGARGVPRTPKQARPISWPTSHSTEAENGLERAHTPRGLPPAPSPAALGVSHLPAESGSPRMEEARSNSKRMWVVIVGVGRTGV